MWIRFLKRPDDLITDWLFFLFLRKIHINRLGLLIGFFRTGRSNQDLAKGNVFVLFFPRKNLCWHQHVYEWQLQEELKFIIDWAEEINFCQTKKNVHLSNLNCILSNKINVFSLYHKLFRFVFIYSPYKMAFFSWITFEIKARL